MSPRSFAVLALATVASIALATHAVRQRNLPVRTATAGEAMFPNLLDRLNEVREIRVTTAEGKLTVASKDQGWVLAEKAGYPVDQAQVRSLALALANLQLVEAKTADAGRLSRLELEEPGGKGSKSRLVELTGAGGAPLAAAVIGKPSPSLYGSGRGGVYVRRAGDNQAWLASGELDLPTDAITLIGDDVVDVPIGQVARVVLEPSGAAPVTLSRPDAAADFTVDATLPEGRKLDPVKVEALAGALGGLTMSDVRPASKVVALPEQRRLRFETFEGDAVAAAVQAIGEGDAAEHWVTLRAIDAGSSTDAEGTSSDLEAAVRKLDGWAYKVPPYLADQLRGGLDQLLADPAPAS